MIDVVIACADRRLTRIVAGVLLQDVGIRLRAAPLSSADFASEAPDVLVVDEPIAAEPRALDDRNTRVVLLLDDAEPWKARRALDRGMQAVLAKDDVVAELQEAVRCASEGKRFTSASLKSPIRRATPPPQPPA